MLDQEEGEDFFRPVPQQIACDVRPFRFNPYLIIGVSSFSTAWADWENVFLIVFPNNSQGRS